MKENLGPYIVLDGEKVGRGWVGVGRGREGRGGGRILLDQFIPNLLHIQLHLECYIYLRLIMFYRAIAGLQDRGIFTELPYWAFQIFLSK